MSSSGYIVFALVFGLAMLTLVSSEVDGGEADVDNDVHVDDEKLEYAKGSVCGYCQYCEFCPLCDKDCPCEASPTKPNCHMCKYCKFCYLCSAVCDTICQPGGMLDKVTASIVNALPSLNQNMVEEDLESVSKWIGRKKDDEL